MTNFGMSLSDTVTFALALPKPAAEAAMLTFLVFSMIASSMLSKRNRYRFLSRGDCQRRKSKLSQHRKGV